MRIILLAIKSWNCDDSRRLFFGEDVPRWSRELGRIAERKLGMIDAATSVLDMRIPRGNMLEKLEPKSENRWSIRINRQHRIRFVWQDGNAYFVEIIDYH